MPRTTSDGPHRVRPLPLGLLAPVSRAAAERLGLPRTLPSSGGVVLTFDDGPHPEGTPMILEILARYGLRAIFFLVGEQVERRPQLAARIARDGHLVALHGHCHRLQLRMSAAELGSDLRRGTAALEDAVGIAPAWHRPPYGIYSPPGLAAARAAGMKSLLWSHWGKDWRRFTTPARIAARATAHVGVGDVVLLHDADFYSAHDSHRRTAQALPAVVAALNRKGLATVLPV